MLLRAGGSFAANHTTLSCGNNRLIHDDHHVVFQVAPRSPPHPHLPATTQPLTTSQHQEKMPLVVSSLWSITTAQGARSSQLQGGGGPSLRSSLGVGMCWGAAAAVGCDPGIRSLLSEVAQPWAQCAGTTCSPWESPSPWSHGQTLLSSSQGLDLPKQAIPRDLAALRMQEECWEGQVAGQGETFGVLGVQEVF